ncbi:hypothetical protein D3C79_981360 [compost metagenome]
MLQYGGVVGNLNQLQAAGTAGQGVESGVQAIAGVCIVVDQLQVLQALLGLGQQDLRIQQKLLQGTFKR